jgi:hypothetical protein
MKLSKLFKILDPDHDIAVIEKKSRIAIFEGEVRDFDDNREWKVKRIDNSYTHNFEIYVKEIKKDETKTFADLLKESNEV